MECEVWKLSFDILNDSIARICFSLTFRLQQDLPNFRHILVKVNPTELYCIWNFEDLFLYPSTLFECLGLCSVPLCTPHYPSLFSPEPSVFSPLSVLVSLNFSLLCNLCRDADTFVAFSCLAAIWDPFFCSFY